MNEKIKDIMTIDEVSDYLRTPRSSLYKLAQKGRIPCQKVGRHWRFRKQAIEKWLDKSNERERQGAFVTSQKVQLIAMDSCLRGNDD